MIQLIKKIIAVLPWLLLLGVVSWLLVEEKFFKDSSSAEVKETYQSSILERAEQIGKLELIKYNFQEVTEVKKVAEVIDLKLFKYKPLPDSKAVLISSGMAVGCIDLTKVVKETISEKNDTLYITLPPPELCLFKIDLEKSRIYDLQIDYMRSEDQASFMDELYKLAESNIRTSALKMGILEQTRENARTILKPLFEGLTGKIVILNFSMTPEKVVPEI